MLLYQCADEFLTDCTIRRLTPKTIQGYKVNTTIFLRAMESYELIDVSEINMTHVKRFIFDMTKSGAKGTYINNVLKVVKVFLQYCNDEGYTKFDPKPKWKWVKEEKPLIRAFSVDDANRLINYFRGSNYTDLRNKAIIMVLLDTGIRCNELCSIMPDDVKDDYIVIVNAKNRKQRAVAITPIVKKALLRYERAKESYYNPYRAKYADNYFLSFHGRAMTVSAVENVLKEAGKGIKDVRVSPHTCRHFFAQQQLKMGTDVYTISRLLGHESIAVTQIYLDSFRDEDIVNKAKNRSVLMNMNK